jgi:hypothetical protein
MAMNRLARWIGIVLLALLACFTGNKVFKMAQIRGFVRGPVPETEVITARAAIEGSYGAAYWVAWKDAPIEMPSPDRMNLPKEVWDRFHVGDPIEVLRFRHDPHPYFPREDIFTENGNFIFDGLLFLAWLAGIVTLLALQFRRGR